jgi:Ribbon-helix-helix protein
MKNPDVLRLEERTARLTILIDPRKKVVFERLCAEEDLTSSQVVRRMIRSYIEERTGKPWSPDEVDAKSLEPSAKRGTRRRPKS